MFSGPVLGWLVGAHPWHRSTVVLVIVSSIVTVWTVVLAWPGPAPFAVLVVLVLVTNYMSTQHKTTYVQENRPEKRRERW